MFEIFVQHTLSILSTVIWWLLITGIGLLCLGRLSIPITSRCEMLFVSFGIGLVIVGHSVFLFGVADALQPFWIACMLSFLAILALSGWLRLPAVILPLSATPLNQASGPGVQRFTRDSPGIHSGRGNSVERVAGIALSLLLAAAFLLTVTPESGKDALIYHLAVPKLFLQHGGFYTIPGNIFADYPLLAEMHYLLALFVGNDITAKTMNYVVLIEILAAIYLISRNLAKNHAVPALSMLVFLSIPSVFAVSHTAYNDLFVAFFTLGAFYAFLRWSEGGLNGWLVLSGIFTGGAIACKYTALLIIPLGCLGILFFAYRDKRTVCVTLKTLLVFGATAFVSGSAFYLKNWLVTGNPFHPFLYAVFGGRGWDADQARLYDIMVQSLGMGRELMDYILLPFNLSFRAKMDSIAFDGSIGPVFFLVLPFLAVIRRETSILLIVFFSFFSFLFWASSAQQIRYLIHLFPLLAILVGATVSRVRDRKIVYPLLLLMIGGGIAFNCLPIARDFIRTSPLKVAVGLESREDFLSRMVPVYPMYRFANENLPADAKIFLIYMKNHTFFCKRDCYSDAMFETHTIEKILRHFSTPEDVAAALRKDGFTHLMYDKRYLAGPVSPLSAKEQGLFLRFQKQCLSVVAARGPWHLSAICR